MRTRTFRKTKSHYDRRMTYESLEYRHLLTGLVSEFSVTDVEITLPSAPLQTGGETGEVSIRQMGQGVGRLSRNTIDTSRGTFKLDVPLQLDAKILEDQWHSLGDTDLNGQVTFSDFLVLSANFGTQVPAGELGDANRDGTVDFGDFLILSANFGRRFEGSWTTELSLFVPWESDPETGFIRAGAENLMLEWVNPDFPDHIWWDVPHLWLMDPWPVDEVFNMELGAEIQMDIRTDDTRTTVVEPTHLSWTPIHQGRSTHSTHEAVGTLRGIVTGVEEFYVFEKQPVPLSISLDKLNVIAQENAPPQEVVDLLSKFDLQLVKRNRNLFTAQLSKVSSKEALVQLARQVKAVGGDLVVQSGLVVSTQSPDEPNTLSDEFIAGFSDGISRKEIDSFNQENQVEIVMENPYVANQFLLRVTEASLVDSLTMANQYEASPLTEYSYPNFIGVFVDHDHDLPNDPLLANQWHHVNTGQAGGTIDADADTGVAWHITQGSPNTIIAVIENGGFDMSHPDLTPNYWVNTAETPGNGLDDDGNGFTDDLNGWDFVGCTSPATSGCGDNNPSPGDATENHGTAVAGVAAARGDNSLGVSGACPTCSVMPLRTGYTSSDWAKSLAFGYAQQNGARIMTNSWGGGGTTPNTVTAINTVTGAGAIVLFAAGNTTADVCTTPDPRVSLANVIGVSSSTNQDRKVVWAARGNCVDILAPSHRGYAATDPYTGTLSVTTTDVTGAGGYNNGSPVTNCPTVEASPPPANARDYTACFGGTSSATPLTAGVVGLMLSVNPGLTRVQVQRLLQDTADKIEDSAAGYNTATGFSNPGGGNATHAFGRLNAAEAVEVAAPVVQGGKGGVDIFVRDNRLDWGNTEQPSNTLFEATRGFLGHWRSEDIKVDSPQNGYQAPPTTAAAFESFVDEIPSAISGDVNRVYVRVRNRGPVTASTVNVKLHWTQFGTALPALPGDFWTAFPGDSVDTSQWRPLDCSGTSSSVCTINNLAYSGASVANTAADGAQIVSFDFPAPAIDPLLANHFCLTAMIDSTQDPISLASQSSLVVDNITPNDNNVTHRNYHNLADTADDDLPRGFLVRNPRNESIESVLRLEAPDGWRVELDKFGFDEVFTLGPQEETLVTIVKVERPDRQQGEYTIVQEQFDGQLFTVMGGLTFRYLAPVAQPDLVIRSLEVTEIEPNSFQYQYVIQNVGNAPANLDGPTNAEADNVSVQAMISADPIFNNGNDIAGGGSILGLSPLGFLDPGKTFTGTGSFVGAFDTATHPFLTLKVDWGEVVPESNEANNTAFVRFPQLVVNEVFDIQFTPPSPADFVNGEDVDISFSYVTSASEGVLIWARPFSAGALAPNYAAHPSPLYADPSGTGTGFFTIDTGQVHVDQVRFQMWTADQSELLFETFVNVDFDFVRRQGTPPIARILVPDQERISIFGYDGFDEERRLWYTDVVLSGEGEDEQDGLLTGNSLRWTTHLTRVQAELLGTGPKMQARLYSNICTGVTHTVTLTAVDSDGELGTDTVSITIGTLC